MKRSSVFFAFFTFFSWGLYAQYISKKDIPVYINASSATFEKKIFQDQHGFLWYGVYEGIVKETGSNTQFFPFNFDPAKKNIYTHSIYHGQVNNVIWVTTEEGVLKIDQETGEREWLLPEEIHHFTGKRVELTSVFEDREGTVWFGSNTNYIYSYSGKKELEKHPLVLDRALYLSDLYFLKQLEDGKILIKFETDYFLLDQGKQEILYKKTIREENISGITSICVDNSSAFKKGESGFYRYKNQKLRYTYLNEVDMHIVELPFRRDQLKSFYVQENEVIVKETALLEIHHFSRENNRIKLSPADSVELSRYSWDYVVDKDKDFWIINGNNLSLYQKKQTLFNTFLKDTKPTPSSARGFVKDNQENIFLCSYSGFYTKEEGKNKEFQPVNFHKENINSKKKWIESPFSIYRSNDNFLWIYGFFRGLLKVHLKTEKYREITIYAKGKEYSTNIYTNDMIEIGEDRFLLAGSFGLLEFDAQTEQFVDYPLQYNGKRILEVRDVFFDKVQNVLWVGTKYDGLYRKEINTNRIVRFSKESQSHPLVDNNIEYVYKDKDDIIWVATTKGLQKIDDKNLQSETVSTRENSKNKHIVGILESGDHLWLSTYDGLVQLNKKTYQINSYFENDGLANNEFNSKSFFKENDSSFYFGGINGITHFNPKNFENGVSTPKIFLSSITKYNTQIHSEEKIVVGLDSIQQIRLPYEHNFLFMNFDIDDIKLSEKCSFKYRIPQLRSDWIDLGNTSELQLLALEPNTYTMQVKGINSKGMASQPLEFTLVVEEIFYNTLWFKSLMILLGILFLFLWELDRRKKVQRKYLQKTKLVALEAKALRAQMNPHFVFNALNGIQNAIFNKGELEANKYISSFSRLLRYTLEMSNSEYTSVEKELLYIKAYIELEAFKLNDNLVFNFSVSENINQTNTFIPCMLIQPIVENAIQHGLTTKVGVKQLDLIFFKSSQVLMIEIIDNGIGRKAAEKNKNKRGHTSMAGRIMNDRIDISNNLSKNQIELEIVDMFEDGVPSGTKVILKIDFEM